MKWIVELDPRGRDALQYRCKHVNFCENSDVPGEEEFLFAPYSVFTVISLTAPPAPTDDDPVESCACAGCSGQPEGAGGPAPGTVVLKSAT